MTDDTLRDIFGRFENLNLLFLIRDLENGKVAKNAWIVAGLDDIILCPVAHGVCVFGKQNVVDLLDAVLELGPRSVSNFVAWWDGGSLVEKTHEERTARLLDFLRGLYAERLQDADAVQGVICDAATSRGVRETAYEGSTCGPERSRVQLAAPLGVPGAL